MNRIVLKIDGMSCGMCESHVSSALRNALNEDHITSSAKKGETVILTENIYSPEQLRQILDPAGYRILEVKVEQAPEKQGLFSGFFSKKKR